MIWMSCSQLMWVFSYESQELYQMAIPTEAVKLVDIPNNQ